MCRMKGVGGWKLRFTPVWEKVWTDEGVKLVAGVGTCLENVQKWVKWAR